MKKVIGERNSRIELVRIICIVLIIFRHYTTQAYWGLDMYRAASWSWQVLFLQLVRSLGSAANNVFLLISGYYMIGKKMNWKRIVSLICEMFFYSWLIMLILGLTKAVPLSLKDVVKALFPIWFGYNWFVCCYVVFCCFLPFILPLLNNASKKNFLTFLIVALSLSSFAKTFRASNFLGDHYSVDHFIIMFSLGAYIRKYGIQTKRISWKALFFLTLSLVWMFIACMSIAGARLESSTLIISANYFDDAYTAASVLLSLFFFLWVVGAKPMYCKSVNWVARSVIGIYILHDNPLLKQIIWNRFYPNAEYLRSSLLPIHCFCKVFIVFAACMVIDQLRIVCVDNVFQEFLNKKWDYLTGIMKKKLSRFIPAE